jgi:hypothetical protein
LRNEKEILIGNKQNKKQTLIFNEEHKTRNIFWWKTLILNLKKNETRNILEMKF